MIHIVTQDNRGLYAAEFERLAGDDRVRRAALASLPRSVHILAFDASGAVEFACRLRPAPDLAPEAHRLMPLLEGGAEALSGPGVLLGERIFAAPYLSGAEPAARRRRGELRLAALEEARDQGAERIVEFVEPAQLYAVLRAGWRARLLGLPADHQGAWVVAVEIDVSADAVGALRESLAAGPSRRLRLVPGATPWSAPPKEIETFLTAAQQLDPAQLAPLLAAMRAAVAEEEDG